MHRADRRGGGVKPLQKDCRKADLIPPLWTRVHWAAESRGAWSTAWCRKHAQWIQMTMVIKITMVRVWSDLLAVLMKSWCLHICKALQKQWPPSARTIWKAGKTQLGRVCVLSLKQNFDELISRKNHKRIKRLHRFWPLKSQDPKRMLSAEWLVDIWNPKYC